MKHSVVYVPSVHQVTASSEDITVQSASMTTSDAVVSNGTDGDRSEKKAAVPISVIHINDE